MKRLVSWNVNGIRACVNKGFVKWLKKELPDVICLQEIKAKVDQIPSELMELEDLYDMTFFPAERPGYSGVATLTNKKLKAKSVCGLDIPKFDIEGRTIITTFKNTILLNGYFPNGQRDHGRVPYKLEFSEAMLQKALGEKENFKNLIITGDYNTAHHPIDLANPKTNTKSTGFLLNERAWMDNLEENGFTDTYRKLNPEKEGGYTWWTYRNGCRDRNIGWRIDYFFTNNESIKSVKDAGILHKVLGSDHCPIYMDITSL